MTRSLTCSIIPWHATQTSSSDKVESAEPPQGRPAQPTARKLNTPSKEDPDDLPSQPAQPSAQKRKAPSKDRSQGSPSHPAQPSAQKRKAPSIEKPQDLSSQPAQHLKGRGSRKKTAAAAASPDAGATEDQVSPVDAKEQPVSEAAEDQQLALAEQPADVSETEDEPRPAKRKKKASPKKKPAPKPKKPHHGSAPTVEPYIVPADFDRSLLPSADVSSKKPALLSLAAALCVRFMLLRKQVKSCLPSPYAAQASLFECLGPWSPAVRSESARRTNSAAYNARSFTTGTVNGE